MSEIDMGSEVGFARLDERVPGAAVAHRLQQRLLRTGRRHLYLWHYDLDQ